MKKLIIFIGLAVILCLSVLVGNAAERKKGSNSGTKKQTAGGPFSTLVNINNISMWIDYDGTSARNPSTGNSGVTFPRGTGTSIYADGFVWGGNVNDGGSQNLRVNGGTYQQGNVGGRIISKGVAENSGDASVRIYRVRRDYQTADLKQDAAELNEIALKDVSDADMATVRAQYKTDWLQWPASKGAPYYDRNNNGIYDPDPSGSYDPNKDEPGLAGADQVVWFVINDLNGSQSTSFLGSDPIGLEVQVTLWGYARTDQLGNVVFKKYKYIYKGTASGTPTGLISNMYVGQWSDPDLGDFSDDYEGCDTSRIVFGGPSKVNSLGYVYNSTTNDGTYKTFNLAPPAMGYDFFAGPIVAAVTGQDLNKDGIDDGDPSQFAVFNLTKKFGYVNLPMTSWAYFAAGGTYSDPPFDYVGAGQWYNLLRGLTPVTGAPFQYSSSEPPTKFWLSGDPVGGTGYLDGSIDAPGDRRMVMATGPFEMRYDYTVSPARIDTQEVVVALLGGLGSDRLSSINVLRYNDLSAQSAYDNLFQLPKAPPAPIVAIAALEKQIILNWGGDEDAVSATENDDNNGFKFEGYNVYQLPSATATRSQAIKLATYDLTTDPVVIFDVTYDQVSGSVLSLPVQIGSPTVGVQRFMSITYDRIRNAPLVNGQPYYFAVTAYNYNGSPSASIHSLENPLQVITVVPQAPNPGVRYNSSFGDTVKNVLHAGVSEGVITPLVVDPTKVNGHTYEVTFSIDTLTGGTLWNLWDRTSNTPVFLNQTNQTDDNNYIVSGGMQVKVAGPPPGMKDWSIPSGARRWTFANADGNHFEGFFGAIGWEEPNNYFNGAGKVVQASELRNVLIKLATAGSGSTNNGTDAYGDWDVNTTTDPNMSYAYRYLRRAAAAAALPEFVPYIVNPVSGYPFQDYKKSVPFSAWNVEVNPPQRLAVGHLENNAGGGLVDGKWWPAGSNSGTSNTDGGGPREWFFIFNTPYTDAIPDPAFQASILSTPMPVMWWGTVNRRGDAFFSQPPAASGDDQFLILANHVNTVADTFRFTAPTVTGSDSSGGPDLGLAKGDVSKINVFPNPYYAFNTAETNRFVRFVTFNHLPPGDWRIRIFNLAGTMVKLIRPSSPGQNDKIQFATWDLNNENGLPVASGVYIAHIVMPHLGETKILKLVIIQEQQVLDFY